MRFSAETFLRIRSIPIIITFLLLTGCSGSSGCQDARNISSQINQTLSKIISNPGNTYNSELAEHINSLSKISGNSEVKNSAEKLILNIESLMTSLNSSDLVSAGKSVDAMTTSVQILISVCED